MYIHILGICGTFMAGIARLAKQQGHDVTGTDTATYPPMSTQLEAFGVECYSGYSPTNLTHSPDLVIIGNALSRGNPEIEAVLNQGLTYISGAQWLAEQVLSKYWVLAIAGTHGKTTTSSMLAWILEHAGLSPGFLIGGVPENFGVSARLGEKQFFVVEADEYDTAFFDKRSKFVHYRPRTLAINNLEFDHADIFPDLAAIQRQFQYLVRTVPANGLIIHNNPDTAIDEVLARERWTPCETVGSHNSNWYAKSLTPEANQFEVWHKNELVGEVHWNLIGQHNVHNALTAIVSASHAGVLVSSACEALQTFRNVKRRLELRGIVNGISVYDDFAHHPTAINVTLESLRQRVGTQRIIAVLEPRSNTMRMGVHNNELVSAFNHADTVLLYQPADLDWSLAEIVNSINGQVFNQVQVLIEYLLATVHGDDHILIMSNGSFENIHERLLVALQDFS